MIADNQLHQLQSPFWLLIALDLVSDRPVGRPQKAASLALCNEKGCKISPAPEAHSSRDKFYSPFHPPHRFGRAGAHPAPPVFYRFIQE